QEQFQRQGLELKAALELNTLDAFRGIVKQGNMVALLPQAATLTAIADPQLVTRPTDPPRLSRQVALVTTQDRLEFPPIRHFCQLVQQHQSSFGVNRSATVAAETGG
ncbi:MAG: LysR family transcriptional regulator substrate-binding protein, partial [Cyanobacteria bacterium P01_A01_bin.3]